MSTSLGGGGDGTVVVVVGIFAAVFSGWHAGRHMLRHIAKAKASFEYRRLFVIGLPNLYCLYFIAYDVMVGWVDGQV